MNSLLVVLLLALIGLIGARLTFARRPVPLGPRIAVATGLPFLFLGFLLGPHLLRVLAAATIEDLTPLLALGLGWIGVLFGLQLDREALRQFPVRYLVITWLQATVAFIIVLLVGQLLADAWSPVEVRGIVLAVAATACVSTPAAIALVSNTYQSRGRVTRLLFYAGSLDAAVGIVALGLTQAAHHTPLSGQGVAMSFLEWLAVTVLLGSFFGLLFLSLTRIWPRAEELMLLLIGLVLFAAGTAFFLELSPLLVCMIAGIVIGNLSTMRRRVYAALSNWEKPIYVMLLVLAGALLRFPSWWVVPLAAAYLAARILAKWVGGLTAAPLRPADLELPRSFGLALIPQGGISLAMAISFFLIYVPEGPEVGIALDMFLAVVVIAVGVSDLIGPFLVKNVLERANEIDRSLARATAAGGA
ncbi:MAG: hypothetical protein GWN99_06235 [Gemmatimonadetes bacterium]|uniref:Cation/H+ exchanger transmembrane domain-containing protein n=1 Tax=Candidatus Kutchimonas denitrificans TaxID=3056748 RepID=A0AAE4ZBI5_9BACT|nr:hypothetical protein [Gemmatimonadota bacterium]NIR76222.1 hypothetical protein [Candidatus Kutchimonas denitrificans]NIS00662.1 hypothetical protein [Gemmatimonadota bacterium]NIT66807.1 hypothetical protein [Gemmatimonadota bacterium]NIV23406.1 hypothetical protein [Gemmatimonadota bacterium]